MSHNLQDHPVANIFPLLSEEELKELAQDIKDNGLKQTIVLHEDKILDGRNRYRACKLACVEPRFEKFKGDSAASFVISMNLKRRHLSASQRGMVGADAEPFFTAEAKERQREHGGTAPGKKSLRALVREVKGKAAEKAAATANVSPRYVQEAKAIKKASPALAAQVKAGEKTITQARREITRAKVTAQAALPSNKYRVIYADPPWKYGDSRERLEGTTGASAHYPSMPITELCALPVIDLAENNAVLFLWVTSPLLPECFQIITAWGFQYKASFVWDKVKHNIGHYNSVRHEFLLICTRGSCLPDSRELIDSVQSIERGEHSAKPQEFRVIIERMYPVGKKLELFARAPAKGWDVWGNQCQK
jgi:N6-adenosine-specific RNA methylase IME4